MIFSYTCIKKFSEYSQIVESNLKSMILDIEGHSNNLEPQIVAEAHCIL